MKIAHYHKPFSKIIISQLIISFPYWRSSYPFGGLILRVEFQSPFSYCDREFDMETDVST